MDAVYHQNCSVSFRTNRGRPTQHSPTSEAKRTPGRPEEPERIRAFQATVAYFEENDEEQLTVTDLVEKMQSYLEGSDSQAYCVRRMKDKLNEHFKDQLFITEINGKSNVVTFRHRAATILSEFYKERNLEESQSDKCMHIVQTAAKLIRSETKEMDSSSSDKYPFTRSVDGAKLGSGLLTSNSAGDVEDSVYREGH